MSKGHQEALAKERAWRAFKYPMDHGSWCENAPDQTVQACAIMGLYGKLADALLEYERRGYKLPPEEQTDIRGFGEQ